MTVVETEVGGAWIEPIFTVGEGAIKVGIFSVSDGMATAGVPVTDATATSGVETVSIVAESIFATVAEAEILVPSGITSGTKTEG